jgi:glucokinase
MKQVVIGIDIGGTFTKMGIVDREGNVYAQGSIASDKTPSIDVFIREIYTEVEKMKSGLKEELSILGIGIGAPNSNYYKGTIENAANLKWKGIIPFTDKITAVFKLPAVLTNDANAAALGEMIFGGAKGMKNFIVITLGTGLGSGIVVNGDVVYGNDGFAGELGHTIVKPNGRECGCGMKGCLETYVSAPGIKRTVFELFADLNVKSELRNYTFEKLNATMISKAAQDGDPIALKAFEITGEILGAKLADAVAMTSPEAIFFFGGLAKAGELLFKPVRKNLEPNLLFIFRNKVKLLPSGLTDKNTAVMGASALIWKELDKKPC